jgi:hypothetical protein
MNVMDRSSACRRGDSIITKVRKSSTSRSKWRNMCASTALWRPSDAHAYLPIGGFTRGESLEKSWSGDSRRIKYETTSAVNSAGRSLSDIAGAGAVVLHAYEKSRGG